MFNGIFITEQQTTHSKVKNIKNEKLEVQPYLSSHLSTTRRQDFSLPLDLGHTKV